MRGFRPAIVLLTVYEGYPIVLIAAPVRRKIYEQHVYVCRIHSADARRLRNVYRTDLLELLHSLKAQTQNIAVIYICGQKLAL